MFGFEASLEDDEEDEEEPEIVFGFGGEGDGEGEVADDEDKDNDDVLDSGDKLLAMLHRSSSPGHSQQPKNTGDEPQEVELREAATTPPSTQPMAGEGENEREEIEAAAAAYCSRDAV